MSDDKKSKRYVEDFITDETMHDFHLRRAKEREKHRKLPHEILAVLPADELAHMVFAKDILVKIYQVHADDISEKSNIREALRNLFTLLGNIPDDRQEYLKRKYAVQHSYKKRIMFFMKTRFFLLGLLWGFLLGVALVKGFYL